MAKKTYFIAVAHEMMDSDQWLENDYPVWMGGPFDKQVCQLRNWNIRLVCTLKKVYINKNKKHNIILRFALQPLPINLLSYRTLNTKTLLFFVNKNYTI